MNSHYRAEVQCRARYDQVAGQALRVARLRPAGWRIAWVPPHRTAIARRCRRCPRAGAQPVPAR